jgi:hypothetical protein
VPKLTLPSYLHRSRHGVYGLRWTVPNDLRDRFRRAEFRWSLRTRNRDEAQVVAYSAAGLLKSFTRRIRRVNYEEGVALGEELMQLLGAKTAADRRLAMVRAAEEKGDLETVILVKAMSELMEESDAIGLDMDGRLRAFVAALPGLGEEAVESLAADHFGEVLDLRSRQSALRERINQLAANLQARSHELLVDRERRSLTEEFDRERDRINLQAADMVALVAQRAQPAAPRARPAGPEQASHADEPIVPQATISRVLEAYLEDKAATQRPLRPDSIDGYRDTVSLFVEAMGDLPLSAIDRSVGHRFVNVLQKLPPSRTKNPAYRNMSVKQLIAVDLPERLAPRTVNKHVERLSSLCSWQSAWATTES